MDLVQAATEEAPALVSTQWGALLGVIVGAVLGGVAQVIGSLVQHRNDRRRDSLQRRADAYLAFLRAVEKETHHRVYRAVQRKKTVEVLSEATFDDYLDAKNAVLLYGSGPVRSIVLNAQEIVDHMDPSDLDPDKIRAGDMDGPHRYFESYEKLGKLIGEAATLMRKELGIVD